MSKLEYVPWVPEIRAGQTEDGVNAVALLLPNGHPVDRTPWLLIAPSLADGQAEGYCWVGDDDVKDWTVVPA